MTDNRGVTECNWVTPYFSSSSCASIAPRPFFLLFCKFAVACLAAVLFWNFFSFVHKGQRCRVEAETQSGWRWTIIKNMPEMGPTPGTQNFGALHAVTVILL